MLSSGFPCEPRVPTGDRRTGRTGSKDGEAAERKAYAKHRSHPLKTCSAAPYATSLDD